MPTDRSFHLRRLWLLATLAAPALSAQEPRLAARLSPGTALEVQHLVDSATRAALPAEPLIQKALEGESKGADSARIVGAVEALLQRLRIARRSLGSGATEPELVAAAAALRAGASPVTLGALRSLRPDQSLVVPLSVLADIIAAGVTPEQAWSSVRDMANTGAGDAAFLALRDRLTNTPRAADALPPEARRPPTEAPPASRPVRP
ncbi:MAG: hypothetical protein ABI742_09320 [Gemmatimonadota bacterium]